MRDENIRIRAAAPEDAAQLLDIYTPYVEQTAITFEYDVPTLEEFQRRIARTLQRYPYLTAERGGELLGYAYLSPFVGRAAYQWAAETSIYLRMDSRGLGLGRALYEAIEGIARAQNLTNLEACIGRRRGRRTSISPTTAWSSTPTWATAWWGSSTSAAINSAGGTTWHGWRSCWPPTFQTRPRCAPSRP